MPPSIIRSDHAVSIKKHIRRIFNSVEETLKNSPNLYEKADCTKLISEQDRLWLYNYVTNQTHWRNDCINPENLSPSSFSHLADDKELELEKIQPSYAYRMYRCKSKKLERISSTATVYYISQKKLGSGADGQFWETIAFYFPNNSNEVINFKIIKTKDKKTGDKKDNIYELKKFGVKVPNQLVDGTISKRAIDSIRKEYDELLQAKKRSIKTRINDTAEFYIRKFYDGEDLESYLSKIEEDRATLEECQQGLWSPDESKLKNQKEQLLRKSEMRGEKPEDYLFQLISSPVSPNIDDIITIYGNTLREFYKYTYRREKIYTDCKPNNFIIKDKNIHLIDWSSMHSLQNRCDYTSGTKAYIPSELITRHKVSVTTLRRAPVYSLGIILARFLRLINHQEMTKIYGKINSLEGIQREEKKLKIYERKIRNLIKKRLYNLLHHSGVANYIQQKELKTLHSLGKLLTKMIKKKPQAFLEKNNRASIEEVMVGFERIRLKHYLAKTKKDDEKFLIKKAHKLALHIIKYHVPFAAAEIYEHQISNHIKVIQASPHAVKYYLTMIGSPSFSLCNNAGELNAHLGQLNKDFNQYKQAIDVEIKELVRIRDRIMKWDLADYKTILNKVNFVINDLNQSREKCDKFISFENKVKLCKSMGRKLSDHMNVINQLKQSTTYRLRSNQQEGGQEIEEERGANYSSDSVSRQGIFSRSHGSESIRPTMRAVGMPRETIIAVKKGLIDFISSYEAEYLYMSFWTMLCQWSILRIWQEGISLLIRRWDRSEDIRMLNKYIYSSDERNFLGEVDAYMEYLINNRAFFHSSHFASGVAKVLNQNNISYQGNDPYIKSTRADARSKMSQEKLPLADPYRPSP